MFVCVVMGSVAISEQFQLRFSPTAQLRGVMLAADGVSATRDPAGLAAEPARVEHALPARYVFITVDITVA